MITQFLSDEGYLDYLEKWQMYIKCIEIQADDNLRITEKNLIVNWRQRNLLSVLPDCDIGCCVTTMTGDIYGF